MRQHPRPWFNLYWRPNMNTLRKIIAKLNRIERVAGLGQCWEWTGGGTKAGGGYGRAGFKGTTVLVHRLMYSMFVGDLDKCEVVMHICDNERCCNPDHLIGGTSQENALDASRKSRLPGKIDHEDARVMRELFHAGASRSELRKRFGVCSAVVTETLCGKLHPQAGGPTIKARKMLGAEHATAKMCDEKVRQIRALRENGKTFCEIAKRFNLHHSTVMDIVNRKTWRQVV